jgi:hypothetical protein
LSNTPTFLKQLGERRARAEGEVQRLEALATRVAGELEKARADLASYDRIIKLADHRLDPTQIPAITTGRVPTKDGGKKLNIEATVLRILGDEPGTSLSTREIAIQLVARMCLEFEDETAFGEWSHNSVSRRLKKMASAGLIVRLHEPNPGATIGMWALPKKAH